MTKHAEHGKHAAPAEEIADQAGHRGAQQIAGHGARQRAPDRDLPLFRPDQIAGQAERDRKNAAGADAGKDARREQQPERRRHRAENVGNAQQHQAHDHQPRLAEQVGRRAEHRLDDRKGEGERGGETGGGRDADAKIVGHMRQHRIQRARRQAGSKRRERDDIEGRRQAARCGHGGVNAGVLGQRVEIHQPSSPTLRTRAAAPCWARPTAHDPDRGGSR